LSTEAPAGAAPIPATMIANRAQFDAQSVVSSSSAPTVVSSSAISGSTICSMLSNAAHLRRDDDKERFIFASRWQIFTIDSMLILLLELRVLLSSLMEEPMVDCVDLMS
jgi:hypothetical protein